MACDLLATGYGLVPNVRLARMLGCALDQSATHPRVAVDALQATSVRHVYAAGEACGIAGRDAALVEGAMAGHAAAGAVQDAMRWQRRREHARAFAAHLARHFALDPRVLHLAEPDTIVCRCEDVRWRDLDGHASWRDAKLETRCGMGPCQGRVCGSALAALGRFDHAGQREPLFPVRLDTLACADEGDPQVPAPGS
jgi:NADPH-dependent 2,4-dienoyl-CoA reductase/sulfur reductase-like enzyme